MRIGTWNILSWYRPGAAIKTVQELEQYKMDITAVQEIRWPNAGNMKMSKSVIFFSGNSDNRHEYGTGFVLRETLINSVIDFEPVNERICCIRLKGRCYNYSLISVYAPTEETEEEEKEKFYEQLEQIFGSLPQQDMKIILGDLNAKIGKEETLRPHIGKHSLHDQSNDNGLRIADFAAANNLCVKSTMFEHKDIHKQTWVSNDGRTRNQIDHIIIDARHSSNIVDVRSLRGADADTDHYLVTAKIKIRLSTITNKKRTQRPIRWNTHRLKEEAIAAEY
ncbi:hypothetical protein RN001_009002 [Aquatica leii]|uniref:Endonuclease/exonuclease/phosphatase domain-containing protein n=1 Tax=Aquatica leii TaxID=1421715 RepID=A0AAN7S7Z4_9COLE|nr:hypothetical protein RN001_009002 [Aquatica leii]